MTIKPKQVAEIVMLRTLGPTAKQIAEKMGMKECDVRAVLLGKHWEMLNGKGKRAGMLWPKLERWAAEIREKSPSSKTVATSKQTQSAWTDGGTRSR